MDSVREGIISSIEELKEKDSSENDKHSEADDQRSDESVRSSLEDAIEHHRDDSPANEKLAKSIDNQYANIREQRGEVEDTADKLEDTTTKTGKIEATTEKVPIPELAKNWDKLSPEIRDYLVQTKTQIEANKQKLKHWNDIDELLNNHPSLAPYKDAGPAFKTRVISSLFQWIGHLSHPDYNTRVAAFENLASRYGIDLAEVPYYTSNPNSQQAYLNHLQQEHNIQQQQYQQQVTAAEKQHRPKLESWAKGKLHFEKLRGKMAQILAGMLHQGALSGKDDLSQPKYLNQAYRIACELEGLDFSFVKNKPKANNHRNHSNSKHQESVRDSLRAAIAERE